MSNKFSIYNLLNKFKGTFEKYVTTYLDTRLILALDVLLSVFASFVTALLGDFMSASIFFHGETIAVWVFSSFFYSWLIFYAFKCYKTAIRHTSVRDFPRQFFALLMKECLQFLTVLILCSYSRMLLFSAITDFCFTLILLFGIRVSLVMAYYVLSRQFNNYKDTTRVLVCGKPDQIASAITRLFNSSHLHVVGAVSNNESDQDIIINNVKINSYSSDKELESIFGEMSANAVLFASEDEIHTHSKLIDFCIRKHFKTLVIPSIDNMSAGKAAGGGVRNIKIEDLLGREEIKINMDAIKSNFHGKVVMVTGAAGSIGSELSRQLATFGAGQLILFDNAETPMHNLRLELEERFPYLDFKPVVGDVRQLSRLDFVFEKYHPQVVFHAAAYKHVPLMEENPCEAILVNVIGSRNVAELCVKYGVEKMVMISTDKAVNPTNIMGCSKRLAEIFVQSMGLAIENGTYPCTTFDGKTPQTKFVTTRFGNVLGSNGSVIPRFREQIEKGGPVTVTHPEINRFFMTIPEACRLVMEAETMSQGNQIYVFKMGEPVKIDTLARRMIHLAGYEPDKDIKVIYTGLRPGEKLYEEVLAKDEETLKTSNDRIRIATVREYDYNDALRVTDELKQLAEDVYIPEVVKLMKQTVPEFKSKNSEYEKFDR